MFFRCHCDLSPRVQTSKCIHLSSSPRFPVFFPILDQSTGARYIDSSRFYHQWFCRRNPDNLPAHDEHYNDSKVRELTRRCLGTMDHRCDVDAYIPSKPREPEAAGYRAQKGFLSFNVLRCITLTGCRDTPARAGVVPSGRNGSSKWVFSLFSRILRPDLRTVITSTTNWIQPYLYITDSMLFAPAVH
jgi:hypothetical protein